MLVDKARSDNGKPYITKGGKLATGELIRDIVSRIKVDDKHSGTEDFKNQIPRHYNQYAEHGS